MEHSATLYIYPGINKLPSIDPTCCQLMLLINYYELKNVLIKYYKLLPTTDVPCLVRDGKKYYDFDQIVQELRSMCSKSLPPMESNSLIQSRITAYKNLITTSFQRPVYYHFYNDKNNRQHAYNILKKSLIFPLNMVFVRRKNNEVEQNIDFFSKHQFDIFTVYWDKVQEDLQCFSDLLGTNQFLLEVRTELDAFFVGYLAPVLLAQFPSVEFTQLINRQRNLAEYITNYIENYSKHPNPEYHINPDVSEQDQNKDADVAPASTLVLAALAAGTTMVVFGMVNGIIKLN